MKLLCLIAIGLAIVASIAWPFIRENKRFWLYYDLMLLRFALLCISTYDDLQKDVPIDSVGSNVYAAHKRHYREVVVQLASQYGYEYDKSYVASSVLGSYIRDEIKARLNKP
jgi:hypothetical protein